MTSDIELFKKKLDLSELEKIMKACPDQIEQVVDHHFSKGVYTRTLFIPKGSLILGKRHRHETLNILLKGKISVYMGPDEPVKHIEAPCVFNSEPGVRKLGYAHEDVLFSNIHPTKLTNIEEIEKKFIISEQEYLEHRSNKCLGEQ